jgi:hypothetical protein
MSVTDANGGRAIVFDGICDICSGGVRFPARRRIDPPFEFIPMQSTKGKILLERFGMDTEDPATFLVLDRGLALTQSEEGMCGPWSRRRCRHSLSKSRDDSACGCSVSCVSFVAVREK